ncbi:hypothetical protein F2Q69_00049284 [Brassica cretica]|uniref:Uncharacterized protein n=1 Tax=Brassica cretica TaxID=69181 RepID=A0A8S9PQ81_BRACR|nr:hypothetical protein F2Q69_00049284 [Brassica cretica]
MYAATSTTMVAASSSLRSLFRDDPKGLCGDLSLSSIVFQGVFVVISASLRAFDGL